MRHFRVPGGIGRLSLEARLVYTGFAVFMLVGYVTSVWFYLDDGMGLGSESARAYYLGEDAPAPAPTPAADGPSFDLPEDGPALDLPAEAAGGMRVEKPARQVMETFHFHLFSIPVVLLIIAHLYMMCEQSRRTKVTVIVATHVVTLAHLVAPPLIRFVSPSFALLMGPTAVLMLAGWVYMTVWPIWEMWRAPLPEM